MTGLQNGSHPGRADYDWRAFALALSRKHRECGLSLRTLADDIGVTIADMSRAMGGQIVSTGKVIALCRWLGVPVENYYLEPDPQVKSSCFTEPNVKHAEARAE